MPGLLMQLAEARMTRLIFHACRSAGKQVDWDGNHYTVEELTEGSFGDVDIALFSAGGAISKRFAPIASNAGCTVHQGPACVRFFLLSLCASKGCCAQQSCTLHAPPLRSTPSQAVWAR